MKSDEIKIGDELRDGEGELVYTVIDTAIRRPHVVALVRYAVDGGTSERMWEQGKEVPLVRP